MSVARSASATTSLPKPGALTPAGTGRSSLAISVSGVVGFFFVRVTDSELCAPSFSARTIGEKPRRTKPNLARRSASVRLPQAREHLQPGVAVGRVHSVLLLEGEHCAHGIRTRASVDAVGLEPALVQPPLDLLHLGKRRHALAAGELAMKAGLAADEIAEMAERERVALR